MEKYKMVVQSIPEDMMEDFKEFRTLIFFDQSVPQELKEISITHNNTGLQSDIKIGDRIFFDTIESQILDVGEVANKNIMELGHLVILFQKNKEQKTVELIGQVLCSSVPFPKINLESIITIQGDK